MGKKALYSYNKCLKIEKHDLTIDFFSLIFFLLVEEEKGSAARRSGMKQCQIIFQFCRQPLTQEECKLLLTCSQNKCFCGFLVGRESESVTFLVSLGMGRAHMDTCVL